MDRRKEFATLAALVVLTGASHAQVVHHHQPVRLPITERFRVPHKQPTVSAGPGWRDVHELSSRLEAVEAENRWLRDEVSRSTARELGPVYQASYCEDFDNAGCGCADDASFVQSCPPAGGPSWNLGPVRVTLTSEDG